MKLTDSAKTLYDLMYQKDFHIEALQAELETGKYDADAVSLAAFQYVHDCDRDIIDEPSTEFVVHPGKILEGYASSHLFDTISLLLSYGLDPNIVYSGDNDSEYYILYELMRINNGYQAADTLLLLAEHGANLNVFVDGSSLLDETTFLLGFDLNEMWNRTTYDALVHFWMALIGCGAHDDDGHVPFDACKGFDIANLKNHRQYYYGAIHSDCSNDHMEICFFDKNTNWEVGRY